MPLNAHAASDGTENIQSSELELSVKVSDGSGNNSDIASSVTTGIWAGNPYPEYAGMRYYRIPKIELVDTVLHFVYLTEPLKLTADHEYELDFSYGTFYVGDNKAFVVTLRYFNSSGEEVKSTTLYQNVLGTQDPIDVNFSFKPDVSDIKSGYTCKLEFAYLFGGSFDLETNNAYYFISDEIGFVDKDDDSGWFQKILNAINSIPENIQQFFIDLGNKFNELGDKINSALGELGTAIIDGIREALEWAFVPDEEFMDNFINVFRTLYEYHFGVFAQATLFLTDTLEYIDGLMDYDYEFTFPEVSIPIAGKTCVIIEKQTVNMQQWLEDGSFGAELYSIYQTCVWAIIIYCILKYGLIVEDVILNNTSSIVSKETVGYYL